MVSGCEYLWFDYHFKYDYIEYVCVYTLLIAHLYELLPDIVLIFGSEVLVDWIKHAFLLKFNNIKPEVSFKALNAQFSYLFWEP